jgi:cell wall-associated NlpC family hydrolase
MNDSHTNNFGRRFIAVVASVVALVSFVAVAAPLPVSAVAVQTVVGQNPAAVIVPNIDPLALSANQALEQLRVDLIRFDGVAEISTSFIRLRRATAEQVAERLALDPDELEAAWADSDINHQTALLAALTQVGTPYKRFAMKPGIGFDCSGLTSFAWSQAGFSIPRSSTQQIRAANPRTYDTAQAGDLLRYPGHVMMWLGVGKAVVHSPQPRQFVEVRILATRSMKRSIFGDPTE